VKDDLFADLWGRLEEQNYSIHPPDEVLQRYVRHRLPDEGHFSAEVHRLLATRRAGRWTLAEVSLHVATCRECAARVAELRRALARPASKGRRAERRLRRWALKWRLAYSIPLASVAVGLIILLLNIFLFNSSPHHQNYIAGGKMM